MNLKVFTIKSKIFNVPKRKMAKDLDPGWCTQATESNSIWLFWMCATPTLTPKELATQQKLVILGDNLNLQTIHQRIQIKPELFLEAPAIFNQHLSLQNVLFVTQLCLEASDITKAHWRLKLLKLGSTSFPLLQVTKSVLNFS